MIGLLFNYNFEIHFYCVVMKNTEVQQAHSCVGEQVQNVRVGLDLQFANNRISHLRGANRRGIVAVVLHIVGNVSSFSDHA